MDSGMGWILGILLVFAGMAMGGFLQKKRMKDTIVPRQENPADQHPPEVWSAESVVHFVYELEEDTISFSGVFWSSAEERTHFDHAMELFKTSKIIHENDRILLFRLLERCRYEDGWVEGTLRLALDDGQYSWLELRMCRCGNVISGTVIDMAHWKQEVDRWKEKAARDTLTGLHNREYFEQMVRTRLQAEELTAGAMVFIDVDNFKSINDTKGHRFGDEVLCWVANQIQSAFRQSDVIARYGGDEFLVFAPHIQKTVLEKRLAQLIGTFRIPLGDEETTRTLSGSIGAALYPRDGETYESLMDHADSALYEAKAQGKDRFLLYEPSMKGTQFPH